MPWFECRIFVENKPKVFSSSFRVFKIPILEPSADDFRFGISLSRCCWYVLFFGRVLLLLLGYSPDRKWCSVIIAFLINTRRRYRVARVFRFYFRRNNADPPNTNTSILLYCSIVFVKVFPTRSSYKTSLRRCRRFYSRDLFTIDLTRRLRRKYPIFLRFVKWFDNLTNVIYISSIEFHTIFLYGDETIISFSSTGNDDLVHSYFNIRVLSPNYYFRFWYCCSFYKLNKSKNVWRRSSRIGSRQWIRYVQSRFRWGWCTTCCIPIHCRPSSSSGNYTKLTNNFWLLLTLCFVVSRESWLVWDRKTAM